VNSSFKFLTMRAAFVAVALLLPSLADGFAIRVDAHEEECFYEAVTTGTKVRPGNSFPFAKSSWAGGEESCKHPSALGSVGRCM
jgi:hypothetical protein